MGTIIIVIYLKASQVCGTDVHSSTVQTAHVLVIMYEDELAKCLRYVFPIRPV